MIFRAVARLRIAKIATAFVHAREVARTTILGDWLERPDLHADGRQRRDEDWTISSTTASNAAHSTRSSATVRTAPAACHRRRIDEILQPRRRAGPWDRSSAYPPPDGAETLWFQFAPNRDGPEGTVYVSPAREDLVAYCVQELVAYSDPVRSLARPSEQNLLILIARKRGAAGGQYPMDLAIGLTYHSLRICMNGTDNGSFRGAFERWQITQDGSRTNRSITTEPIVRATIDRPYYSSMAHRRSPACGT